MGTISSGITYGRLRPGEVPPFEELEAMRFQGYQIDDWAGLLPSTRAVLVAHFRYHRAVELHQADAAASWQRRQAHRGTRRR